MHTCPYTPCSPSVTTEEHASYGKYSQLGVIYLKEGSRGQENPNEHMIPSHLHRAVEEACVS